MYLEFGKWLPPRLCACLLIHWTNEYDTRLAELRNAFYVPREAHFPVVQHTGRGVDAGTFHSALHWCILWSSPQLKHCMQFALPLYKDKTVTESPEEDYKDGEGSRRNGIWGAAEVPRFAQPRAEELRRGLMAAEAPHRERRGSWGLGKGSAPEGGRHGTVCLGLWEWHWAAGVQGVFAHCSHR